MISVIMSVYKNDNEAFLVEAIDSILNQSLNCDLLIYKDGVLPKKLNDVITYYESHSSVYVFSCDANKGLATGLNKLINYAFEKGYKYIARMDSDDISRPTRIEKQVNFLENNNNIDVLGTSCREFGASFALDEKHLPKTHEELLNFSITRCPFIHPSVMFRSSVFEKKIRYPENTVLTEDMALWFLLLNNGFQFANINEILLDYRLNENTINRRKGFKKAMSEINIRTKNMISLKQVNIKNISLIGARIVFHLMPSSLVKLAYKKAR
ncbi:glycosyltransferase [Photobacterium carnosum]|uniref:glycosyltransferase n=1 Tax=Photobacterium carnosum TaxID=2023717 RepID=UPI00242B396B|nr:glycosyltransferase [Photobacterium carnosum]